MVGTYCVPSAQYSVPSTQPVKLNWTNYFIVCIDSIHSLQSIYIIMSSVKKINMYIIISCHIQTDDWRQTLIYSTNIYVRFHDPHISMFSAMGCIHMNENRFYFCRILNGKQKRKKKWWRRIFVRELMKIEFN